MVWYASQPDTPRELIRDAITERITFASQSGLVALSPLRCVCNCHTELPSVWYLVPGASSLVPYLPKGLLEEHVFLSAEDRHLPPTPPYRINVERQSTSYYAGPWINE